MTTVHVVQNLLLVVNAHCSHHFWPYSNGVVIPVAVLDRIWLKPTHTARTRVPPLMARPGPGGWVLTRYVLTPLRSSGRSLERVPKTRCLHSMLLTTWWIKTMHFWVHSAKRFGLAQCKHSYGRGPCYYGGEKSLLHASHSIIRWPRQIPYRSFLSSRS